TLEGTGEADRLPKAAVLRVETHLGDSTLRELAEVVMPNQAGEAIDLIERKAEGFAYFAQCALAAVRDDFGDHRGAIASVHLVDGLDPLFAPLVLEVDVDVGRLAALGR